MLNRAIFHIPPEPIFTAVQREFRELTLWDYGCPLFLRQFNIFSRDRLIA